MPTEPVEARLARLLGLVPYLARTNRPVPIKAVAAHFGVSERQIRRDLHALWLVGTPGMLYDDMLQFGTYDEDDPFVDLRDARGLTRPLRLNYPEAVALTAALRAITPLVADRPELAKTVAATLAKLDAVTHAADEARSRNRATTTRAIGAARATDPTRAGFPAPTANDHARGTALVDVALPRPGDASVAQAVTAALVGKRRLAIDYVDAADHPSRREVDPARLHIEGGAAYLLAWCWLADAPRTFRMDRILAAHVLEQGVQRQPDDADRYSIAASAPGTDESQEIELVFAAAARWLIEELPITAATEAPDGSIRIRLRVRDPRWLRRLLLAQAHHVRSAPPDVAADVAAAAQAALRNYTAA